MKITTKLALKYINKNKKRSISCIIGITLATILVTTIFAILSSFQEYMIDVERKDKNWEAEFISIPYSKVEEIAKDENIKEVSVYYEFGDSEDTLGLLQERIYLVAYDQNALKNANLILIEGRFPENEDEIIVSNYAVNNDTENPIYIGKKEIHKFNGEMKEFTIVGIVDGELEEDDITPEHIRIGQITYLDEAVLNEETIVNVRVLTNNVKRIYTTTQSLVKKLELKKFKNINKQITGEQSELLSGLINSMQEHMETELKSDNGYNQDEKVIYNTNLLNYELVSEIDSSFERGLFVVGGGFIFIVAVVAITVVYTAFKMTYQERIKEFGVLSSIGMDKKQKKIMLLKESIILGTIGIIIGLLLGMFFSYFVVKLLQILINNIMTSSTWFQIGNNTLTMKLNNKANMVLSIPYSIIILIVFIIYIITIISSMLPMGKINKISPIDAIRNVTKFKIKRKNVQSPKVISKLFRQEGELAYKNIRREKSKYRTIVISLTVSIIVFLVTSSFVQNMFASTDSRLEEYKYEYRISNVHENDIDNIMNYLNEDNLVKDYLIYKVGLNPKNPDILISSKKVSNKINKILNDGIDKLKIMQSSEILADGSIKINTVSYFILGNTYDEILKKAGISELKEDEIIITNTTAKENSKYGDVIEYTNYQVRRYN